MKYKLDFYTSYHQFYIADKDCDGDTGAADFWSDEAFEQQMAVTHCGLGIGIDCWGDVKGELELFTAEPAIDDLAKYDHVVEAGFTVTSGVIQILDCPNSHVELSLNVQPGTYRVRVYGSNFASVAEPDLNHDTDDDFYRVEIWPDTDVSRKVLKQYDGY